MNSQDTSAPSATTKKPGFFANMKKKADNFKEKVGAKLKEGAGKLKKGAEKLKEKVKKWANDGTTTKPAK